MIEENEMEENISSLNINQRGGVGGGSSVPIPIKKKGNNSSSSNSSNFFSFQNKEEEKEEIEKEGSHSHHDDEKEGGGGGEEEEEGGDIHLIELLKKLNSRCRVQFLIRSNQSSNNNRHSLIRYFIR